ncbi:hypothetical protein A2U01_0041760, partial [Trifolium medium]|nr:hypothetical protein [Trifolium medium]
LKNQLKKQNLTSKHQLGEFCEQFAFDVEKPPNDKRKKGKEPLRKPKEKGLSNPGQHNYRKSRRKYYTRPKPPEESGKRSKKRKANKLDITCHRCETN